MLGNIILDIQSTFPDPDFETLARRVSLEDLSHFSRDARMCGPKSMLIGMYGENFDEI